MPRRKLKSDWIGYELDRDAIYFYAKRCCELELLIEKRDSEAAYQQ